MSILDDEAWKLVVQENGITITSMWVVGNGSDRMVFHTLECWVGIKDDPNTQSRLVKVFSSEDESWSCINLFEDPKCISEDELNMFIMIKPKMFIKIRDAFQYAHQYQLVKSYPTNR